MAEIDESQLVETYSLRTVCSSAILTVINYFLGFLILFSVDIILGFLYIFLCISTILISMKLRCSYCHYYGRRCSMSLGLLVKFFFEKGDPNEFKNRRNFIPTAIISFGTLILPLFVGVLSLIFKFSIAMMFVLVIYIIMGFIPNFIIRGDLCDKCVQGQLGCPAYDQMKKRTEK